MKKRPAPALSHPEIKSNIEWKQWSRRKVHCNQLSTSRQTYYVVLCFVLHVSRTCLGYVKRVYRDSVGPLFSSQKRRAFFAPLIKRRSHANQTRFLFLHRFLDMIAWKGCTETNRRRHTRQHPGTKSAPRPGDKPPIHRRWTRCQPRVLSHRFAYGFFCSCFQRTPRRLFFH